MRTTKAVFFSIIALIMIGFIIVGTISIVKKQHYTNNDVTFKLEKDLAYCTIDGKYYYGKSAINSNSPTKVYHATYSQVEEFSNKTDEENLFYGWNVGESRFIVDDTYGAKNDVDRLMFTFTITNLNKELPLKISLKDVGANQTTVYEQGEPVITNLCYTKVQYHLGEDEPEVLFDNENNINLEYFDASKSVVNLNDFVIVPVGSYVYVEMLFVRHTKSQSFNLRNNFVFDITAVTTTNNE